MRGLIRASGVLLMLLGLGASFFSLFPLVYYIDESIAINEMTDFALRLGDLNERYKKQLTKGLEFILKTMYRNTMVFICTWLSFALTLLIKFCGVEIFFLREVGRRAIVPVAIIGIVNGIICSMFILQLLGMINALIVVGVRDLEKYAYLSNIAVNRVIIATVLWVIFNGLFVVGFTHRRVKEHFV